jgi:hypothetical protein
VPGRRAGPGRRRRRAGQHRVQHGPERVDVGPKADVDAPELLRSDVLGRAQVRVGQSAAQRCLAKSANPEVGQLDLLVGPHDDDVLRLEVAVGDSRLRCGREPLRDLDGQAQRALRRQGPLTPDHLGQAFALEVLHRDKHPALVGAVDLVHAGDMRRTAGRREARLPPELLHEIDVTPDLAEEHLDGDLVSGGDLFGQVHGAGPAAPQPPDHPIPWRDRRACVHRGLAQGGPVHLADHGPVIIDPSTYGTPLHLMFTNMLTNLGVIGPRVYRRTGGDAGWRHSGASW